MQLSGMLLGNLELLRVDLEIVFGGVMFELLGRSLATVWLDWVA